MITLMWEQMKYGRMHKTVIQAKLVTLRETIDNGNNFGTIYAAIDGTEDGNYEVVKLLIEDANKIYQEIIGSILSGARIYNFPYLPEVGSSGK